MGMQGRGAGARFLVGWQLFVHSWLCNLGSSHHSLPKTLSEVCSTMWLPAGGIWGAKEMDSVWREAEKGQKTRVREELWR